MFQNLYKYDKILILRAFACILVFLSHVKPPSYNFFLGFDGVTAVRIFFILSGYLMGKNYLNGKYDYSLASLKNFYYKRIARIAPLYYVVVFCLFIFSYQSVWSSSNWYKILGLLTFTFDYDAQPYFTGSLWSLSVEMQFYLMAPLLIFIIFRYCKSLSWAIWIIFISLILSLTFTFLYSKNLISTPNQIRHFLVHFFCFPVGISLNFLYKYFDERFIWLKEQIFKYSNTVFVLNLGLIYLLLNFHAYITGLNQQAFSFVYLSVFTLLSTLLSISSIYLAESNCRQVYKIDWKQLLQNPLTGTEILGIISYSFYLWHGDILYFFIKNLNSSSFANYFLVLGLGFVSTFALSLVSYFLIEKKLIWPYISTFLRFFSFK